MSGQKVLHSTALALCQEAMGILRQEQTLTAITPTAPSKVERVCYRFYETSRKEVLTAYGWSFVRRECKVFAPARVDQGRFLYGIPDGSIRVLACYGTSGHKVEYTTRSDGFVYSAAPLSRIVYIEDEEDLDFWPTSARKAFAYCLAKNVCMEITGRTADLQFVTQQFHDAEQKARTEDARQSGTGTSVYGRNYMFDCMTGRANPFRRTGV